LPPSLVDASEERKLKAFEEFWNSGVPRFGDQESEGWDHYVATCGSRADLRESELVERELQTQLISSLEDRISSSSDDAVISWIEMERELDRIESRPRRRLVANVSTEEGPPPFTEIEFSDLRILRIKCFGPDAILVLLRTLGVHFCGSLGSRTFGNSAKVLPCIPTFRLLDEWDLLPPSKKLFPVPSVGANDLALKMVYTMTKIGHSPEFVFSLLETKATQLEQLYKDRPGNVRKAKFEEYLREVMSEMSGMNFGIPSDDFNLAAVVYALSILRRWVQKEEATLNCDVSLEEGAQKKRKLKKRELPFTRRQLVDKLSECLFKYSGTPLHLLGNRRLQMLLKLLLLLVQPLSCFESPRAICIALQIYFEYGRGSSIYHPRASYRCGKFAGFCQTPSPRAIQHWICITHFLIFTWKSVRRRGCWKRVFHCTQMWLLKLHAERLREERIPPYGA
uniref:Rab-GAP TBC domain-containing protein n=1 Tax=Haemonchus placei TaxID=6290 RepID=A0A158QN19_HAEPC